MPVPDRLVQIVDSDGDTAFGDASPLGDNEGTPTAGRVGAVMYIYDSTSDEHNRQRSANNLPFNVTGGTLMPAAQFMANGITAAGTFDRVINNTEVTLLTSAARTTTQTSADITTYNTRGITVVLDVTAIVDTPSLVVTIDGKDSVSGKWVNLLTGAAVATVSTNRYRIYPGLTAVANVDVNAMLPRVIRIVITAADSDSATYSCGYVLHV